MKHSILTALAAAALLAAAHANAQPAAAAPVQTEASPFSPFVYEALGATPRVQLRLPTAARAAPKAAERPTERRPDSAAKDPAAATIRQVATPSR